MIVERKTYNLTTQEMRDLFQIRTGQNAEKVWDFWREIAESRGLDYQSIIGSETVQGAFTALPLGHNKHWCYPIPLKCIRQPRTVD